MVNFKFMRILLMTLILVAFLPVTNNLDLLALKKEDSSLTLTLATSKDDGWTYSITGNYNYSAGGIEISGGNAHLTKYLGDSWNELV